MNCRRIALVIVWLSAVHAAIIDFACAQAAPDEEKKSSPVDPTGTWKWDYEINGNTAEFKLKLAWDGKELTGKYTGFDRTTDIQEAKLEKDELSFVTKREFNGQEFTVHFNGEVKPDDIAGTVRVEFGDDGEREFDWNAKRVVENDDVVGTWDLRVVSPNGVIEPRLTITAQGDELRGKSVSEAFGELEAKNVKLKDNTLAWEISVVNNGVEFQVKYSGKPRGNAIEGSNEFTVGDNTGTMEFTGKRTPPEEKKEEQPARTSETKDTADQ